MKKLLSLLAILLVAVGCTNEEKLLDEPVMRKSVNTVKASFEETADTRTHFLNDTKLTWDKGDVIQVFSDKQKNASPFTYQGNDVFSGEAVNYDETIYAFYSPAGNAVVDWETKTVQATFPNSLVHNPDAYADPTFMVAKSGNSELKFMQTVSILKFSLKGTKHITKLTLAGNNGEVIAGVGTIDLSSDEPIVTFDGDGETSIVMQANVTLDEESSTSFYFQLPETVLEAGFTLTLEGEDATTGDSFKVEKRLDNRFVPKRSHVYSFTSVDVDDAIVNGDEPSENAQPYYVIDGNTLTFYYDDQMDERVGAQLGWLHGWGNINKNVVYAELTPSCRFYKPASTNSMFYGYENLVSISGLEYLDTSNVTDMSWMFYGCPSLTSLDLSGFDTSKVTSMSDLFARCSSLTSLDVSGFDTSNVTDMFGMFNGCSALTSLDVSGFDTSKVTDMSGMFNVCSSLTSLDVSGFDTSNVMYMKAMFANCSSLTSLDVSGFDTSNVTDMVGMFDGCSALTNLDVSGFDTSKVMRMIQMFFYCSSLTSLDVSGFDTSNVTDMSYMFVGCSSLTSLDVSGFDTSKVTSMIQMFDGCSSLTILDLSGFETSNVTIMRSMFYGCSSLKTIYGGNWEYIDDSGNMFYRCNNLVGGQGSKLGDNNVYDDGRSAHIDGGPSNPGLFTAKADGPSGNAQPYYVIDGNTLTFYYDDQMDKRAGAQSGWLHDWGSIDENVVYAEFTPSCRFYKPESTWCMFYGYKNLVSVSGLEYLETSKVTDMRYMFESCSSLTSLDVSGFNTSNVTYMKAMFANCSSLTSLDVSGFDTSKVTDMGLMFHGCSSLTSLDVSGFDTSNVKDMRSMFVGCSALTSLDLSSFDTSNVTDMSAMFLDCPSLMSLDLSSFDTSNVTDMEAMFANCSSLTSLDVSGFKTSKVTNMLGMFADCSSLTSIDLSGFDTSNVTNMSEMFVHCSSLASLDLSGFNTSKVMVMSAMFVVCSSLTSLDLNGFDTSNVTNMSDMFADCSSLTSLDLSGFDTSNVTKMSSMFYRCSSLETIYGGNWNYIGYSNSKDMFYECDNLVGGQGSKLGDNNVYTDGRSAHIDGGPSNPGLFTQKL